MNTIKAKLVLWFTVCMALIAALCLGLMLLVNERVTRRESYQILSLSVRSNLSEISIDNHTLSISPDFQFYPNDVYMLIYGADGALLSGQAPPDFAVDTPLENGTARFVDGDGHGFYILDLWIPSGWEDGVWLRGVLQSRNPIQMMSNLFTLFLIAMPFCILCAAGGGYLIARRALAPIERIAETAGDIDKGNDLSRRIGLTSGSDETPRLADAFDHMLERLERSFEAEKQFTSDASHELRTPTSVILAQCDYAEKFAETTDEYREAIEVIHRQAGKMSQLISRLLDITRLDLGTQKLHMDDIDLSEMVSVICEEQDTGERKITLESQLEEGIFLHADSFLISRVITNLLENARKYGRDGGYIHVFLTRDQQSALLRVEDNGIGIAQEDMKKIWQRFYQANSSRPGDGSLGLGLSMARQIVELHGGVIFAESRDGEGSTFTVRLPVKS
ncbi:MAG: HAMP domain-containing histidine kinase [Clostridiales bacterium]|nr:HAMP domain-containing histidine kinase [Clostridiales bacterium]